MKPAPIALFAYNRLSHLRQTLDALGKNELAGQSDLHVFSDGPRSVKDVALVEAVRAYVADIRGFKSVQVVAQSENLGLAQSIISGVTQLCNECGRVIVLEDDLVTSPYFLRYLNEALDLYEDNPEVISIHGYIYPIERSLPETFFIRGADCWGWATWKRGWDLFNPDGRSLLAELETRKLAREFDFDGAYAYTQMLRDQIAGKNNSWAIRWHASAFLLNKLTLCPGRSLVQNIGLDASGTHCGATDEFNVLLSDHALKLHRLPLEENKLARREIIRYFRGKHRLSWLARLKEFV